MPRLGEASLLRRKDAIRDWPLSIRLRMWHQRFLTAFGMTIQWLGSYQKE